MKVSDLFSEDPNPYSRRFDLFIQALILVSIVLFTISTLPDLTPKQTSLIYALDTLIVVVFTLEYILRIRYSTNKGKYIFSAWGIIDFLAILPFYVSLGIDLRSLRIIRLLRVFRALKLLKYNKAVNRLKAALIDIKEELILFFFLAFIFIYLSAVGIYYFENAAQPEKFTSVVDSLWWSLATLTTVGYGDMYPVTIGGRLFTFFILFIGLGIVAVPSGMIASGLTKIKDS